MDFEFMTEMVKAVESEGKYYLEGVASTTDADLQNETVSDAAITKMATSAIGLDLVKSHTHEVGDVIGSISKAFASDGKLHITAQLDETDPEAIRYFNKIAKSKKPVGFSIGGKGRGRMVGKSRIIDSVELEHVMVTNRPANPNTFAVAINKALADDDIKKTEEHMTLEEMLADEGVKNHLAEEVAKAISVTEEEMVAKAGATFSAANKAALKGVYGAPDMSSAKAALRGMAGADADDMFGPIDNGAVGEGIGVEKSLDVEALTTSIVAAVKEGVAAGFQAAPKGSTIVAEQTEAAPVNKDISFASMLRKHFAPNGG
jgi:hypothetical protein